MSIRDKKEFQIGKFSNSQTEFIPSNNKLFKTDSLLIGIWYFEPLHCLELQFFQ